MIEWKTATVVHIAADYPGRAMQEVRVRFDDGGEGTAVHYGEPVQSLKPGDRVLLNTTAVKLGLGTGGVHFVHDVLEQTGIPGRPPAHAGHIMKLRYTSLQRAILSVEEPASPYHELFRRKLSLEGMPVLVGELHSALPAAVSRIRQLAERHPAGQKPAIAYIMTDGAALPAAFSNHARRLKGLGWLAGSVTYGQAYGGDIEAVNKFTALLAARHVLNADIAIALPGPGTVGTGTRLGFSGTETAEMLHAVYTLQGCPIVIPRISMADKRVRHRGISHHTLTVLQELTLVRVHVPLPILGEKDARLLEAQLRSSEIELKHDVTWHAPATGEEWREAMARYGMAISSMGRGPDQDPACFAAIGAAVDSAWNRTGKRK